MTTTTEKTTRYVDAIELALVDTHPNNPRHKATADDELIASVKANGLYQPIVVAPKPAPEQTKGSGVRMQRYVLIAGHRRVAALKKIRRTTAPAIVRLDLVTEGQQVEAMLVENGRRLDLTAIEEAEGYQQLTLFGYKQKDIATAVGRDPKTVSARLKLLKLTKKAQGAVHNGQLSIDDALAIADLDAKDQAELQRAAGGHEFKWKLEQARRRKGMRIEVEKAAEKLDRAGVPEKQMPKGINEYGLTDAEHGMTRLGATFSSDPEDHKGCLAYVRVENHWGPEIVRVCTDISSHDEQLSEDQKARRLEREQEEKAHEERARLEDISRDLRTSTVLDAIKPGIKLDPTLRQIIRALLPSLLRDADDQRLATYYGALGVPDDRRWAGRSYNRKQKDADLFRDHVREIDEASDAVLAKALTAVLVGRADEWDLRTWQSHNIWDGLRPEHGLRYLELARSLGHTYTEIDDEFLTFARGSGDEGEAEPS